MLGFGLGANKYDFIDTTPALVGWDPNYINDNTSHTCLMWYDFGLDGTTGIITDSDGPYWHNKTNATGGNRVTAKLNPLVYSGLSSDGAFIGAGSTGNAMSDKVVSSDNITICVVFTDGDDVFNENGGTGGYSVPFEFRLMEQDASSRVWRYNVYKDYQNDSPGNTNPAGWTAGTRPGKRIFHQWGQYASNTTSAYQAHGIGGDGGAINPPFTPLMSQAAGVQWMTFCGINKADAASGNAGKMAFGNNFTSSRWSDDDNWWPAADGTSDAIDACMKGYDVGADFTKWPYDIDFSVDDADNKLIFYRQQASPGTATSGCSFIGHDNCRELVEKVWGGIIHEVIMIEGDLYTDGTYQYLQNYLVNKYETTGLYY